MDNSDIECKRGVDALSSHPTRGTGAEAPAAGTPDYTMGFSDEAIDTLLRYTAEANAAYLLPYIRPGQRVLDMGCGPGTISVGLAKAAHPGEMRGIDMDESTIELARQTAAALGRENATFQVADVTDMPFEDGYFDVVHCHNVLMHVPDTSAALAEAHRVLKRGGVIGCREMTVGSSFTYPDFGVINRAWDMFEDLLAADDGHPDMGRDLRIHLEAAGFANARVSASFDSYDAPADIEFIYKVAHGWFLSPEITEAAIKYGASTEELCAAIGEAYDRWRRHPGAFVAIGYGEAVAGKR